MKISVRVCLLAVLSAVYCSAAKIKVACIGDSITFGYGLSNRASESYPALLQVLLDKIFPGKYEVRNFGNSGSGIYLDSLRGTQKRGYRWMDEHKLALAWKPDIVISNLGINDCGEYIKEYTGKRKRGQFISDYKALLSDYTACRRDSNLSPPAILIWSKFSPLCKGQRFYRSNEPFLMQKDIALVANDFDAHCIDMLEPLRENMDDFISNDKIHPNANGMLVIAKTTFHALLEVENRTNQKPSRLLVLPNDAELWLCAGQSNMQKGWGEFSRPGQERLRVNGELERLKKVDVRFWDFNTGKLERLNSENALRKSALAVSFAIRRAEKTKKCVCILYVAAGGAPTESFLSESTMCAVDSSGKSVYPTLSLIATNRHRLDSNEDFPCKWVAREYPRRRMRKDEAFWWPVSAMYHSGIERVKRMGRKIDGVLWYQGESNATTCVNPDVPTPRGYQEETLRALIDELRFDGDIPFVMIGLPHMNRPWQQYREVQKKICAEKGAIFVDTFKAGLGDANDVHPRNKIPFAEKALEALDEIPIS